MVTPRTIQAFVFTWWGHESRAAALERELARFVPVTVINSETRVRDRHPSWVHLPESAYFSAQWQAAVDRFDADLLFHVQADASYDDWDAIISRAHTLFAAYPLGVYEPNVHHTDLLFDASKLRAIEPGLVEVPWTDCTCWFLAGDVVRQTPPVDLSVNAYGWGIPRAIAAVARLQGKLCLRDYAFTVKHPTSRGYGSDEAMRQLRAYLGSFRGPLHDELQRLAAQFDAVRIQPQ